MDLQKGNLIIQTDGGRRDGDCAAAAWIIGLWMEDDNGGRYEPIAAHGSFLDASCTVFATEAIALDEASAAVQRIIA